MTAKVRIEFIQRGNGDPAPPAVFFGEQTLTVTGGTPALSNAAPAYNNDGVARVSVISGAVVVAWGASPTGGEANGVRLQAGDQRDIWLPPGKILSFVEAADGPIGLAVSSRSPLTYTSVAGSPFTLSGAWAKVCTADATTKGLRIAPVASASAYDIEWVAVAAGASAPTDTYGEPIQGGEDFAAGLPIGDIYLKSASGQKAVVRTGV